MLGLVSVRLRDGGWSAIGFRRPESWLRLVLIALAAAMLRIVLGDFVIEPLAAHWWPPIHAPAGTEHIAGNIKMALLWLLIIWTFAAFGEEIAVALRFARRMSVGDPPPLIGWRHSWYQCSSVTGITTKAGFSIRAWPVSFWDRRIC